MISFRESFVHYLDRRMFKILLLGIMSGFPWVLIGSALSLWLKEEGLSRSTIGFAGLIFGVYAINFLWAPLIDKLKIPFLTNKIGHRKSVITVMQIIILISFLLFNFPNAKIFLGDSGSYVMGALVALNSIITNNSNPTYSSFFFSTLLFYLFFEVFFSFLRKVAQRKSPIHPDNKHLHMLIYERAFLLFGKDKSNYINSIIINTGYCALILPAVIFAKDPMTSKYWFFSLIAIYLFIYLRLYRLTKN